LTIRTLDARVTDGMEGNGIAEEVDIMIPRQAERRLRALASMFPVVTVTGPRQSGKTTLCRMAFPDKRYVSLEAPDLRQYAFRGKSTTIPPRDGSF